MLSLVDDCVPNTSSVVVLVNRKVTLKGIFRSVNS